MTNHGFTLTRLIDAPPTVVFRAWTEPGHLGWFFSGMGSPAHPEVDLRVGGAWRQAMIIGDDEEYVTGGVYREIVRDQRLVFAWGADGGWPELDDDAPVVTVTFAPEGAGTRLTLNLELPAHLSEDAVREQFATGMEAGWGQTIDRLAAQFAPAPR